MSEGSEKSIDNPMRKIKLEKVVVNMALGRSGEPLEKGMKVIEELTGCKPCARKAKKTIKTFGIRKGEPISCVVTLRGERAEDFLKKAFETVNNRINSAALDSCGNLSFGIREHIEIPGTKYDPNLGIYGFNVSIAFERPGFRVKRRCLKSSKVGKKHMLTSEEAKNFVKNSFGIEVYEE